MRVLPCGDRALLVEFDSLELVLGAHARWSAAPARGVVELVPAARTVLVRIDPSETGLAAVEHWVSEHPPQPLALADGDIVTVPVAYDGDDLASVAEAWECSAEKVIALHSTIEWLCAFIGFAPGFGYLVPAPGQPALPPVPRRATSRPRVPAGSVALAAGYCGVYPRESPGGWQLIGRTSIELWRDDADRPAVITPGTRVRFEAVSS